MHVWPGVSTAQEKSWERCQGLNCLHEGIEAPLRWAESVRAQVGLHHGLFQQSWMHADFNGDRFHWAWPMRMRSLPNDPQATITATSINWLSAAGRSTRGTTDAGGPLFECAASRASRIARNTAHSNQGLPFASVVVVLRARHCQLIEAAVVVA